MPLPWNANVRGSEWGYIDNTIHLIFWLLEDEAVKFLAF